MFLCSQLLSAEVEGRLEGRSKLERQAVGRERGSWGGDWKCVEMRWREWGNIKDDASLHPQTKQLILSIPGVSQNCDSWDCSTLFSWEMEAEVEFSAYRNLIRKDQGQPEKIENEVCESGWSIISGCATKSSSLGFFYDFGCCHPRCSRSDATLGHASCTW